MIYGILGGLLLAFAKSKRRGVLALPAIGLLVFGVVNRVAAASGVADAVGGALLVAGLGFLAASVFGRFRGTPLPGLAPLGLIALLGSLVLASGETVFQAMNESNADERTAVGAKSTDPGASGPYAESPDALDSAEADDVKQLLVELGPDDSLDEIRGLIDEAGVEVERAFPRLTLADDVDLAQTLILTGPADRLETLRRLLDADRENVDHTEWNGTASIPTPVDVNYSAAMASDGHLENDPRAGDQWALNVANAHEAHRLLANVTPAKKAVVAIIDTGVDDRHEDIAEVFGGSTGRGDDNGHGTHCAGIAGAATNNNLGIASLNWEGRFIEIRSYQALSGFGAGTTEEIAQAIIDAARDGADVISLSLGTWAPNPPKVEVEAVEYALDQGAIVVAAA
ncbi:MAG: S8 family serine peptidase, partial [Bacteroidota bacterium]